MYTHIYRGLNRHARTHKHIYIENKKFSNIFLCVNARVYIYMCVCDYLYVHVFMSVCLYVCQCVCVCVHT